jgi:hypothetical protein
MRHSVKDMIITYCRESGCPVQATIDRHRQNEGAENDIRLIKHSNCMRCDIYRMRKWMELRQLKITQDEDDDPRTKVF